MLPIVESKITSEKFQITDWASQIAELQTRITASQQRINQLNEDNAVADGLLQAAQNAKGKIIDQDVIADLLAQLSQLLSGGDNPNGGNDNLPLEPTPQPNDDGGEQEPEEAQALPWHELPFDFEKQAVSEEVVVEPVIAVEPLTGQSCEFNPDAYWETAQPDGSAWDWASPLASPLATPLCCQMEDAPQSVLTGQSVDLAQIAFTRHGFKYIDDAIAVETSATLDTLKEPNYFELIPVSDVIAYFRNNKTGEIVCTYLGGNNKQKLKLWGEWLCHQHSVGSGFQLREAERLTAFRHELKIWGMSLAQIQRLAETDATKNPPSNFGTAPKRKIEPVAPLPKPLQIEDIEVADSEVSQHVSIDVNDVPVGVRLERTDDALITEYRVWAWAVVRVFGKPEVKQKCLGLLTEGKQGITARRPHGMSNPQSFQGTFDAIKYLMQGASLKLADLQAAYEQHQSEVAIAAIPEVSPEQTKIDLFGEPATTPLVLADAFGGFGF